MIHTIGKKQREARKLSARLAQKTTCALVALGVFFAALILPPRADAASSDIVRVGLVYGTEAKTSINIDGLDAAFSAYEFGYFENGRTFVPSGVTTANDKLTIKPGSGNRITVVVTGTSTVVYEMDCVPSENKYLAIRPAELQSGQNPVTVMKFTYGGVESARQWYGAFEFRSSGGKISVINVVSMDDYLKGVVPYEMSPSWPEEALKAQAVAARSYAYVMKAANKHSSYGFDLCPYQDCQVYKGIDGASAVTNSAVDATSGLVMKYGGAVITAFYSASDGGATESNINVYTADLAYIKGVYDGYEAAHPTYSSTIAWTESFTGAQLDTKLSNAGYNIGTVTSVQITQWSNVGNPIEVTFKDGSGNTVKLTKSKIRTVLGIASMRFSLGGAEVPAVTSQKRTTISFLSAGGVLTSGNVADFYAQGTGGTVQLNPDSLSIATSAGMDESGSFYAEPCVNGSATGTDASGKFVFKGAGHGHSLGMSQWGAYCQAKYYGRGYADILSFYYTGIQIVQY
ncbi:MAG: SpoIID/LytB domain-containing protein [Oscillospiraceae bacterium]|nr:SpoIID/LytB domain-containing protein [Oscillospiraceae bacterium]